MARIEMPIWSSVEPELFFMKAEVIFQAHGLVDSRNKYKLCLSAMSNEALTAMKLFEERSEHVVASYEVLKKQMLSEFGRTKMDCVNYALSMPDICNSGMKPTVWLDHLENNCGDLTIDDLKKFLLCVSVPKWVIANIDASLNAYEAALQLDYLFENDPFIYPFNFQF